MRRAWRERECCLDMTMSSWMLYHAHGAKITNKKNRKTALRTPVSEFRGPHIRGDRGCTGRNQDRKKRLADRPYP